MTNNFQHHIKIIEECYRKQGIPFTLWQEDVLEKNKEYIDEYCDVLLEAFTSDGIDEDYEPNSFGIDVENTIGWLFEFRYKLE
mgnify:CR=1 FL=1